MRKILIGKSRNTLSYVGPEIKNYKGKVIWVNTEDNIKNLGLQDYVKAHEPKELKDLDDFDKIEIIMGENSGENNKLLMDFLNRHFKKKLLIIFDKVIITLGEDIPNIIRNEKVGCDKLIIFQSYQQIKSIVNTYADNRPEIHDLKRAFNIGGCY